MAEPAVVRWMRLAFVEAESAFRLGEVPIGAVFVEHGARAPPLPPPLQAPAADAGRVFQFPGDYEAMRDGPWAHIDLDTGRVVARGFNLTNRERNATRHAEFDALSDLLTARGGRPLVAAAAALLVLYVTCEPCVMCAAALVAAGARHVVFGCANPRFGGCGSVLPAHRGDTGGGGGLVCLGGVLAAEAVAALQRFYEQENPSAPDGKRKLKPKPGASLPAAAEADGDADADDDERR